MELHAFHEIVLGGLDDLEAATLQDIFHILGSDFCPADLHLLIIRDFVADGGIHFLQHIAAAHKDILEIRLTGAVHGGSHVNFGTAVGGAGETETDTFFQTVLGSLGDNEVTTLEDISEGNLCGLTIGYGDGLAFLRLIPAFGLFRHGIFSGQQTGELDFTVFVGANALIYTVAGDGKGDIGHLAVLGGLDDLQLATLEDIGKSNGRRLTGGDRDGLGSLLLIFIFCQFSYRVGAGSQILNLEHTAVGGGDRLIHAIAGDFELDAVNNAVLTGFHDLHAAGGSIDLEVGRHRVIISRDTGYHVLVIPLAAFYRPDQEAGGVVRSGHLAVELDGDCIRQGLGGADAQLVAADGNGSTAVGGHRVLGKHIVGVGQCDGILTVDIVHLIGLCGSRHIAGKAGTGVVGRHIRQDRIVEFLQVLVAGELLGHGAGVAIHRIGLVIQLCGRGTEAQSDLPDDELGGTVAGIGILTGFQTGTVRIAVCQRKGQQILLRGGQQFVLVSVGLTG